MSDADEFAGMSGEEQLLVRAHRAAVSLSGRLAVAPFEAETVARLRAYVAEYGEAACEVWAAWRAQPAGDLRARVGELRSLGGEQR